MCGENRSGFLPDNLPEGSPPHVRGKHINQDGVVNQIGITPACAGKT